ncbi:hypothetical protein FPZ42_05965 [Mucilaginibacter achroorhodeus]|uniref:Tetratricopeptide repeat protein n=1 Tax=Mucilaginibacter achroorhodeus TaxID=2599294 RepID=A0A563U5G8_9SPHI|nr:hypothetical protein [Mucilaginibacter achroorhodeus]TWR26588.1 hypothetical protein FPZ42_05965 [Mucilaginibacter achroorhodeus]
MDIYYTIDEKYAQAAEEYRYGESAKALQLLNEIIANNAEYARAHHLLGKVNFEDLKDYQTAGYHFKTCMALEPSFPDNYTRYLELLVFLQMDKQVKVVAAAALKVPGVDTALIYKQLGLHEEKRRSFGEALKAYHSAFMDAIDKEEMEEIEESIKRVKAKMQSVLKYQYQSE